MGIREYEDIIYQEFITWEEYESIKNISGVWITNMGVSKKHDGYRRFLVDDWNGTHTIYLPIATGGDKQ